MNNQELDELLEHLDDIEDLLLKGHVMESNHILRLIDGYKSLIIKSKEDYKQIIYLKDVLNILDERRRDCEIDGGN